MSQFNTSFIYSIASPIRGFSIVLCTIWSKYKFTKNRNNAVFQIPAESILSLFFAILRIWMCGIEVLQQCMILYLCVFHRVALC